ncbi:MAG: Coq4 family protein [Cyanobacteria bacterium J06632_22]
MVKFRQLVTVIRQARSGEGELGDLALLKADALGATASPAVMERLHPVVGYHPPIDLQALSQLPEGTLGYEYARHMIHHNLQPFVISPHLENMARHNVFAMRYAVTHDIFHVILGFDTSYAGEMGVLAFSAAQGYSRSQFVGLWLATVLYPLLAPGQIRQIFANKRRGYRLGQQADCLLAYRFEENWAQPLDDIRCQLLSRLPKAVSLSSSSTTDAVVG